MSEKKKKTYNNYLKGKYREYKIVKLLKKEGYKIVVRSAGSHSPVDVFAIRDGEILFIQSKPKNFSVNKTKQLEKENAWLNNNFKGRFEVR